MSRAEDKLPTRAEQDAVDVLLWLYARAGHEVSYQDISAGVGLPDGSRLRSAVRRARVAAAHDGHRLEQFMRSKDPLRRQMMVTRFHRAGQGDEFGARDALLACRKSVASMAEMQRACAFEAANPNSVDAEAFSKMAETADGAMRMVSGVEGLGSKVMKNQRTMTQMAERIADLEAQVVQLSTHPPAASA
ncbi:hypothetical protein ACIGW8_14050 [Streptomyces sioyaensis]|uniref:hypothetical protein n=1 Tax=Streptomyces sioyaensis TaxID=67364 RepID=UPI0037CE6B7E